MVSFPNKLVNDSNTPIWCAFSATDQNGGPDIWQVRLLQPGQRSEWEIDIDYISVDAPNMTLNGKKGWWKIGQAGSFWIAQSSNSVNDLRIVVIGSGIRFWEPVVFFTDWAKKNGVTSQRIQSYVEEWERLKDRNSPLSIS